ncbi:DUF1573 domain-containing protein [Zunongwangia sp. H14]|uniref:DUF1573 domain-containing protein n=1 Tax=Zunongwangia sp. H14 TaxID=3240792 RepID=UPI0035658272
MKNLVMIAVFILAGIGTASAQAKMEFKSETIDYGTIKKGSDGVRVFEFTNTGNEPLVIEDVKSSCGCTVPKKPTNPILPGESGQIEVKYDTKRVGPIRKTVTVYSNTEEPTKALKIKGTVVEEESSES